MPFITNVFINCPFDDDFKPLLKPLIFTIIYLGLEPQISQTLSSSVSRAEQIKKLIRNSKFGIHDLSRSRPMKEDEFPRFNMPYELGLDIGACTYGSRLLKNKKILILEKEKFHYQKVLSDIAGHDIENHDNDPKTLVTKVRNWVSNNTSGNVPGPTEIWNLYNQFTDLLEQELLANRYTKHDIETMPTGDYIKFTKKWHRRN